MDFSEKYIDMCRAAVELQEMAMKTVKKDGGISPKDFWAKIDVEAKGIEGMIWLPRQDQLQGLIPSMVDGTFKNEVPEILDGLKLILQSNPHVDTLEQLWLCAIMKWVYMKTYSITSKQWTIK